MQENVFADGDGYMDILEFAFNFGCILRVIKIAPYGAIQLNRELLEEDATLCPTTLIGVLWLLSMAAKPEIELSEEEMVGLKFRLLSSNPVIAAEANEELDRTFSKLPQLRHGGQLRFWFNDRDEEFFVDQRGVIMTDGGFPEEPRKVLFDPAKHPELDAEFNGLRLLSKSLK